MPQTSDPEELPASVPLAPTARTRRLRSGLRRHGLVRRPAAIRALVERRRLRFREGNQVDFFDTGRDGLNAMLAAIEQAQARIHLETYILRDDATGRRFLDALAERARAGVEVCLLFDAIGSRLLDRRSLTPLRDAGGLVLEFNPLRKGLLSRTLRRRDHRKVLLIDGRVGFLGGLNVGDEYVEEHGGVAAWRDTHMRIEGPVLRDLQALFLESWFRADGPAMPWLERLAEFPQVDGKGGTRCAVLADGPAYRRRRMRDVVISAIEEARERVLLVSPYFVPGRRILDGLADTAARGVQVQLVTAGLSDHPLLRRAARATVPRLVERGVQVFEDRKRMMHAKLAAFDDDYAIVGTSNLDRQSLELSYEVNLVLEDAGVARWIHEHFGPGAGGVVALDDMALARRSPQSKLLDGLCAWIARLI